MTNEPDEALYNFKKVRFWEKQTFTEADTRAKIIDDIFKNCLGWTEPDIKREPSVDGGFIDYVFSVDGIPRLVVEAKRSGIYFEIPVSMKGRDYKISASISKEKNILSAIEQAQKYCNEKGVPYGIVTNGCQFIIFEAVTIGKEWRQGKAIIYPSLQDIEDNFVEFWNTLSKNAIRLSSLRRKFSGELVSYKYLRPLDRIHNKDQKLVRNHLAGIMAPFISYIFEEITDDSKIDILKNCYVYNKSSETTDHQVKSFFRDQLPPQSDKYKIENFIEGKETAGKFLVNFYKCAEYLRKDEPEGSISVLLGGVGSGKTTFLHRFFKLILLPEEKVLWFYVDFRTAPTDLTDLKSFLTDKIWKYYEKVYVEPLKTDLASFSFDANEPSLQRITKLFVLLKLMGYTLSLVIDNVDQHYMLYPEMQQKVFLEAQNLTDQLKTITLLSLREESFFRHGLSGVLGAYYVSAFHVTSPGFGDLVQSRIEYLLGILKMPDHEIAKRIKTRRSLLGKELQDLSAFFEIIRDSFKSKTSKPTYVMNFIESIAGSNMRKGLEMFNMFLISGNTKVNEMLGYLRREGAYHIAYHNVLRSIILGESRYYASNRSYIMNIFDLNTDLTGSHFVRLKILQYAQDRISQDAGIERGYISINRLKQEGEKIGISWEAVEDSLTKMARFGLVIFENQNPEGIKEASYYKITPTGTYYLEELSRRFVYLDLVWVDTPIADANCEKDLRYLADEIDMKTRFERTDKFVQYLCKMEQADFETNPFFHGSDLGKYQFMDRIARGFKDDKKYIEDKLMQKAADSGISDW